MLNASKVELAEISELIRDKKFRVALPRVDKLISTLGSNFRDLNIMRVECLLELKRPEDAYNLTNSMVSFVQTFFLVISNQLLLSLDENSSKW